MNRCLLPCLTFLLGSLLPGCAQEMTAPSPESPARIRQPLPVDPDIPAGKFTPAAANTYSSVYVKGPYIAMTFDDGPSAEFTATLLDQLAQRKIKATFFLVGQNVAEYPALVRRMVAEGHEVANHSWSHPAFAKMSDEAVTSQLQKTQDAIFQACGVKPTLMRPPYGSITKRQKPWIHDTFGLQVILWSVDPLDWKKPGENVLRSRIVNGAENGAIILAHDIHGGTVRAMPETFDELAAKGFRFVTVSELLAMEQPKPTPTPKPMAKAAIPTSVPLPSPVTSAESPTAPLPTPIPLPQ